MWFEHEILHWNWCFYISLIASRDLRVQDFSSHSIPKKSLLCTELPTAQLWLMRNTSYPCRGVPFPPNFIRTRWPNRSKQCVQGWYSTENFLWDHWKCCTKNGNCIYKCNSITYNLVASRQSGAHLMFCSFMFCWHSIIAKRVKFVFLCIISNGKQDKSLRCWYLICFSQEALPLWVFNGKIVHKPGLDF